jgi:hypothetical protein
MSLTAEAIDISEPLFQIFFIKSTNHRQPEKRRFLPQNLPATSYVEEESQVAKDGNAPESMHRLLSRMPLLELLPKNGCPTLQREQKTKPGQVVEEEMIHVEAAVTKALCFFAESGEQDLGPQLGGLPRRSVDVDGQVQ